MTDVRAVVATGKGKPVEIMTIEVPEPGPGEAVVRVQTCRVCHTDLHYREGGISDQYPFLLGHEAAGVVEAVGDSATDIAPGDFVVLNWRAVCGVYRACKKGKSHYCFDTHNAAQSMTLQETGHRCPQPWASGRSRRRPSCTPVSAPRSTRRPDRPSQVCWDAG